jgi:hypothetical protein
MGAINEFSIVGVDKGGELIWGYHRGLGCGNIIFNPMGAGPSLQAVRVFYDLHRSPSLSRQSFLNV